MTGGHPDVVRRLLEANADRSLTDPRGNTALERAQNARDLFKTTEEKVISILKTYHPVKQKVNEWKSQSNKELAGKKQKIQPLINQLGSRSYSKRKAASERLISMGTKALYFLNQTLDHKNPEIRSRVRTILHRIAEKHVWEQNKEENRSDERQNQ